MFRLLRFAFVVLLMAVFFGPAAVSQSETASEISIALTDDPPSGDPHKARGANGGHLLFNLYEGLVSLSGDMTEVSPALATDWEQLGPQAWRFELRQGVEFHNGEAFDAEAVSYSVDRLLDPDAARLRSGFQHIADVEIVDDYTVVIRTSEPDPMFLERISSLLIAPPDYTASMSEEEFGRNPVGTGPYQLASWSRGDELVLEAYDDYWGGRPEVDRLVFRPIPEASTRVAELRTENIDIITGLNYDQIPTIEDAPNIRVEANTGRRTVFLQMDLRNGAEPLQDVRVRQAMSHAIDRELLIEAVLNGYGRPLATLFRPDMFGFNDELEPHEYRPERSQELLEEAGYPDGFEVRLATSESIVTKGLEVTEAIGGMLSDVGIRAEVIPMSLQALRDMYIGNPNPDAGEVEPLWMWNWGAPLPDAASPLNGILSTGGITSFHSDPEFDEMLSAYEGAVEEGRRRELAHDIQDFLYNELPVIPLYLQVDVYGVNDRVEWQPRKDEYVLGLDMSLR